MLYCKQSYFQYKIIVNRILQENYILYYIRIYKLIVSLIYIMTHHN